MRTLVYPLSCMTEPTVYFELTHDKSDEGPGPALGSWTDAATAEEHHYVRCSLESCCAAVYYQHGMHHLVFEKFLPTSQQILRVKLTNAEAFATVVAVVDEAWLMHCLLAALNSLHSACPALHLAYAAAATARANLLNASMILLQLASEAPFDHQAAAEWHVVHAVSAALVGDILVQYPVAADFHYAAAIAQLPVAVGTDERH